MKDLAVAEDIVPLGEFKAKASHILRGLAQHHHPLVITVNGRSAAVVLSPEEFDRLCERERFLKAIAEGLQDAEADRVVDSSQVANQLAERRQRREKKSHRG